MTGDYLGTMAEQARGTYKPTHRRDVDAEHEQAVQEAVARLRAVVTNYADQLNDIDAADIRLLLIEHESYVELRETHEQLSADERRQYDELIKAEERWRTVSNAYNVLGDAPAMHGIAENVAFLVHERLQCALQALTAYAAVIESIEQAE